MNGAKVIAGKQTGARLCFLRTRVLRHEIMDGMSVALLPMHAAPDSVIPRGTVVSQSELDDLQRTHVVCRNGLGTYVAPDGGTYFAVPVATVNQSRA